ncbi:hypothetical protein CDAR_49611 [Caerostris darwini]|uniref:Uncharacterized protein n=1 Tax=Caerostris darwini TaxID=1538125 RepID=A0AAV4T514_9ARAC|nr:hypothetical protein CDAR_49611 [Caerostris darwini]
MAHRGHGTELLKSPPYLWRGEEVKSAETTPQYEMGLILSHLQEIDSNRNSLNLFKPWIAHPGHANDLLKDLPYLCQGEEVKSVEYTPQYEIGLISSLLQEIAKNVPRYLLHASE